MRVLLDECLDRRLAVEFVGHEVVTVSKRGWAGTRNGKLLALAEKEFDVFVTVDPNLAFQQNLRELSMSVLVLAGKGARAKDLVAFMPQVLESLRRIKKGEVIWIGEKAGSEVGEG